MATKKDILKDYNKLLATTAVFSQKVHNLHWNMNGPDFVDIHELSDKIYEGLNGFIDALAEKIIMQGGIPFSTMKDYLANTKIKETIKTSFSTKEAVKMMHKDLDAYCKLLSTIKNNEFTQPLLDEIIMFADKYRWFTKVTQ